MKRLDLMLDYALWPGLMLAAGAGMAWGMALGRGPLVFNVVYLGFAATLFVLEKVRPHEPEWMHSDGQEGADLAHTLFTKVAVQVTVVALANFGLTQQFGDRASGGIWPGGWPLWMQVTTGLVAAEFGLYWAHRLAHEWQWLWPFHAVHHSSKKLWFLNTGRFHFIDTLKSMVCATPILLLAGAPGDVIIWVSAITAFIGILTHCNVRMRFGWLNFIFNTPGLHRWHHSMDLREGNKNYGENLVLWDLLFGTYFDDSRRRPPADIGIREAMPATFLEQLRAPFFWQRYQRDPRGSMSGEPVGREPRSDDDRTASPG
jgi:sterol desaturase/sphingolipid hydroxylase (fatty acid hydroxylase superfamily)